MKDRKLMKLGVLGTLLFLKMVYGDTQYETYIYANSVKNETIIDQTDSIGVNIENVSNDDNITNETVKEDKTEDNILEEQLEEGNLEEGQTSEDTVEEGQTEEGQTEEDKAKEEKEREEKERQEAEQEEYRILFVEQFNTNKELRKTIKSSRKTIVKLQNQITQKETIAKINPLTIYELPQEIKKRYENTKDITDYKKAYDLIVKENSSLSKQITKLSKIESKMNLRMNEVKAIIKEQERLAKLPPTLRKMEAYDYIKNSVTGLSNKKVALSTLNEKLKSYGKLISQGMPYSQFKEAMGYVWTDKTDYKNNPVKINVNLNNTIDYNTYVSTLRKLSRYDGVYLYKIGTSGDGRNLYGVEIDFPSNQEKKAIMLTGQTHAREFAGGSYILKELVDLVQKAQTASSTRKLLESVKYVAVPIINIDGRENLIKATKDWTSRGELWKAYSNGTDGNRNYPGLGWGEISKGGSKNSIVASSKGYANYPGPYAGSSSETKAMMKWLYHYVVVENANILLDYHQQGSIIYTDKPWLTQAHSQRNINFRSDLLSFLNRGNWNRRYAPINEKPSYSLDGMGSTLTDYAMALAVGAKFSPAYGFSVITDGKKEYTLMEFKDLDKVKFKRNVPNEKLKSVTLEIGYGYSYLGNSFATRKLLAKEYTTYHFDQLLEYLGKTVK